MFEAVEPHMGTLVRIQLYTATREQAAAAFRAAFARIGELDAELSDYKPESELSRVTAATGPVKVGRDLYRVLEAAQRIAADTNGAFDITLGPVTRLWRTARRQRRVPDPAALREAMSRTGYRKIHLLPGQRVRFDQPGMQLDAGGIAKGFAADEALAVLARKGIRRALVAVSGDLAFGDPPPGRRGWRIEAVGRVMELRNAAVSTSGDESQHLDVAGRRYSHIVDPVTGEGLIGVAAISVVARRGIEADALATAASVHSAAARRRWARRLRCQQDSDASMHCGISLP